MDWNMLAFVLLGACIGNIKVIVEFIHLALTRVFGSKAEEVEDKMADVLDEASKELRKKEGD
jgi:hypothetical protein